MRNITHPVILVTLKVNIAGSNFSQKQFKCRVSSVVLRFYWLAAWPRGQRRRFYDNPDCIISVQSAPWSVVTLLRPWIRPFTMIIYAWLLRRSNKFTGQKVKEIHGNIESLETPNRCGILRSRSIYRNEKCADRPIFSI